MAQLEREIIEGRPIDGDEVVQFGSGTETVWRIGIVKKVTEDKALVQFDVDSANITYSGMGPILVPLNNLKKIA